jgi:hypothetical protein
MLYQKRQKRWCAVIPKRCRVEGTSAFSKSFLRTISWITPHSRAPVPIRRVCGKLYTYIREAFPDFRAEIHWQLADGDRLMQQIGGWTPSASDAITREV